VTDASGAFFFTEVMPFSVQGVFDIRRILGA